MNKPAGQVTKAGRPSPALLMMQIRQIHGYLGMLIAPSLIFFAITGVLQIYKFHEAHGAYQPPPAIEKLGRLHKDQVFALGRKGPPQGQKGDQKPGQKADQGADKAKSAAPPQPPKAPNPAIAWLKAFFTLVAVGLVLSTLTGIWMTLKLNRRKAVCLAFLSAGVAIPVVLGVLVAS